MTLEEKAREYAKENTPIGCTYNAVITAYVAGWFEALRSQWKDASKELPEMRQRVLVCYKERDCKRPLIIMSKRIPYASDNPDNPKWEWNNILRQEDVIGWMPLPEHPKTEEK